MKKVSKKVQSIKLKEGNYISLNGKTLSKVKGGNVPPSGNTDHACSGGCSTNAGLL